MCCQTEKTERPGWQFRTLWILTRSAPLTFKRLEYRFANRTDFKTDPSAQNKVLGPQIGCKFGPMSVSIWMDIWPISELISESIWGGHEVLMNASAWQDFHLQIGPKIGAKQQQLLDPTGKDGHVRFSLALKSAQDLICSCLNLIQCRVSTYKSMYQPIWNKRQLVGFGPEMDSKIGSEVGMWIPGLKAEIHILAGTSVYGNSALAQIEATAD